MQEKDILKYIKGESNSEEKLAVIQWIREDVSHQKKYNLLKARHLSTTLEISDHTDTDIPFKSFKAQRVKKQKHYYAAAIVAVLLPLFLWQVYTMLSTSNISIQPELISEYRIITVVTEQGDRKEVTLPDGSTIILNSESRISYPEKFSDSTRNVTLSGEAFFDVKKNPNKPLIVKTDLLDVKVLGTTFNIKSYPEDEKIETTLVTGKVEVIHQNREDLIVLEPSQRAVFNKEKSGLTVEDVDSASIIAWKRGKLIFDQTPLKQVVLDLNRKYNTKFVIVSDTLFQYKYTGTFDNLSLIEVLRLLKVSSPLDYEIKNDKVMLKLE